MLRRSEEDAQFAVSTEAPASTPLLLALGHECFFALGKEWGRRKKRASRSFCKGLAGEKTFVLPYCANNRGLQTYLRSISKCGKLQEEQLCAVSEG